MSQVCLPKVHGPASFALQVATVIAYGTPYAQLSGCRYSFSSLVVTYLQLSRTHHRNENERDQGHVTRIKYNTAKFDFNIVGSAILNSI